MTASGLPLRLVFWLPVLLAASFPVGVITAWAAANRPAAAQIQPPRADSDPAFDAFTRSVQAWSAEITRWGFEYQLPAQLIATVMQIESCGHPEVRSSAGAIGLFQVMPFHFDAEDDPLDPATNAARGLRYLARSLELSGGDLELALAGYNGGHSQISRPRSSWPAETLRYVNWGSQILRDVKLGLAPSPGVQAWLAAGGERLCRQADEQLGLDSPLFGSQ